MRGKVPVLRETNEIDGITPAYAGKSDPCKGTAGTGKDHPRLCGEKGSNGCNFPVLIGSPPPMRGKGSDPAGKK